uniref:Neur_chan_memb domain-containing protein n=1 Tax=Macrostomum lignano TaxID=282301 RepID=A0A1I8H6R7_9PLAT
MQTVIFKWLVNKSVESTDELSMPQFMLKGYPTRDCSKNYTTGSYPCLQVDFILQRDIGYFIIQVRAAVILGDNPYAVYIPTVLIVILSWVAFWINTEAIPARVSLGLLTVLTMTTQSSGAGQSLPRVSYIKAIDVWMSVCLIFVFASLLEFAVVNVYSRKDSVQQMARSSRLGARSYDVTMEFGDIAKFTPSSPEPPKSSRDGEGSLQRLYQQSLLDDPRYVNRARKIDKISRRLFPLTFLIFNVIYWVMYVIVK